MEVILAIFLLTFLQGKVQGQYGVDCDGCALAAGAATPNAGELINPWSISYHILQPKFLLEFTPNIALVGPTGTIAAGLQAPCKTGYVYDFGVISAQGGVAQVPGAVGLPFYSFAAVIIYNIPGLEVDTSNPLTLTEEVIFKIFNFQITTWNDPAILALNTDLADKLTDDNITVVFNSPLDISPALKALAKSWYRFNSTMWPPSTSPTIPASLMAQPNALNATGAFGIASTVAATNYSIGYTFLSWAKTAQLPYAVIINRAGNAVVPNTTTLQAAMDSQWLTPTGYNITTDPYDTTGPFAYPFTLVSWIMVHKVRNLECASRREFFKFLNWCYTDKNAYAQAALSKGSFSPLSAELSLHIVGELAKITCQTVSLLAVDYQDTQIGWGRDMAMVLASALTSVAIGIVITLVYTRNSRITKAAGFAFAFCFLLGCIFNFVSVFFWALLPTASAICQSRIVFVILGETLLLGAMFSKSWEVNKIFQRVEKGDISPYQEIPWWKFCRIFFVILGIQLILLISLMAGDAPTHATAIADPLNLVGIHGCQVRHGSVWFGLEGAFFGLLMIWGAQMAYQTRHVWTRYKYPNESRSILLSIYNLAGSIMVLTPPLFLLDPSEDTLFALVSFAIIYPTTFALSSVYVPKIVSFLGSSFKRSKTSKGSSAREKERDVQSIGSRTAVKHSSHDDRESRRGRTEKSKEENRTESSQSRRIKVVPVERAERSPTKPAFSSQTSTQTAPVSGGWRVLVNPMATDGEIHESVFDSPEAAAKSNLIAGELDPNVRPH